MNIVQIRSSNSQMDFRLLDTYVVVVKGWGRERDFNRSIVGALNQVRSFFDCLIADTGIATGGGIIAGGIWVTRAAVRIRVFCVICD